MREGERIGDRFEIQARAGAGGMAVVYRAIDVVSGALVAVERLKQGLARQRAASISGQSSSLSSVTSIQELSRLTCAEARHALCQRP